ncbi:TetR/AcrR family transcriptional regulator [Sphingobium sp. EM0848]|uniref:TetR/AcrR family transcriptional regulator n=1 Tax=Sphingobium sp. EM0848 TaxID=2743473 RepID=UPI00159BF3D3|nr:TetR/AcrR family transcriptional regulator [Sphingobium sp. EM0848]
MNSAKPSRSKGLRVGGRNGFQQQRKEQTRAAILAGAATVFSTTPYVFATIDELIAAAGVSRATFYTHFDSKLALALAIYGSIEADWQELFRELTNMARPSQPVLEDWLRRLAQIYIEHGYITSLVIQLATFEPNFRQRLRSDGDRLIDMLGSAGVGGFRAALSGDAERIRARLILTRLDQICSDLAAGSIMSLAEQSLYVTAGADELRCFMEMHE